MSGWWQQPTWRTTAITPNLFLVTFELHICHQGLQITRFSGPDTCKHLFVIPAQTTAHLQSQPRWTERECWETPPAQCVAQRGDPSLLWDRKFISMGSICHSWHQSQRVKVTERLAWSTTPQIPVSSSGIFLRWYQRQRVTDEAITGLSLGLSCSLGALKTAAAFWK